MSAIPRVERQWIAGAAWNYVALAAMALAGATMTFLLAGQLGTAALGVFAQLYAIHAIGAQMAVLGAHDSTQKHAAELSGDGRTDAGVIEGGLGLVLISAAILAGGLALLARPIGAFVASEDVGRGLYLVAPGIVFFALNKVLCAALIGRGLLRRYAVIQLLRAAFVLTAVAALIGFDLPTFAVGGIFASAELLLLPCLIAAVRPVFRQRPPAAVAEQAWWRRHLGFGGRGLLAAILVETHLRVDVAMLSYFASDAEVGIYAFASLFAEGLYQLPVVIRTVAYPTIVQLASRGDRHGVARTARRLSMASGALAGAAAVLIALGYPVVAGWVDSAFVAGWAVLVVLLAGMTVSAFVVPFDQLLLQSGQPGRQSALMAVYVGANVILNLVLIPPFGLIGAAAATAASLVLSAALLLVASRVWLGYRPSVLRHRAPAS